MTADRVEVLKPYTFFDNVRALTQAVPIFGLSAYLMLSAAEPVIAIPSFLICFLLDFSEVRPRRKAIVKALGDLFKAEPDDSEIAAVVHRVSARFGLKKIPDIYVLGWKSLKQASKEVDALPEGEDKWNKKLALKLVGSFSEEWRCGSVDVGAPALIISRRLFDRSPADEFEAVIAHEIAHIASRHRSVSDLLMSTALGSGVALVMSTLAHSLQVGQFTLPVHQFFHMANGEVFSPRFLMGMGALFWLALKGMDRQQEFHADRLGAKGLRNPGSMARFLMRMAPIVRIKSGFSDSLETMSFMERSKYFLTFRLFQNHPSPERRAARLMKQGRRMARAEAQVH